MKSSGPNQNTLTTIVNSTAIFGGTFDPPHLGHYRAVEGLLRNPGVERVIIEPSAKPPLKSTQISIEHRLAMVELCFEPLRPRVQIDRFEIEEAAKTGKPGFSFETIQALIPRYRSLSWVIGTDQLLRFHEWKAFPQILKLCHWIVLKRKPSGETEAKTGVADLLRGGLIRPIDSSKFQVVGSPHLLQIVETEAPALSSTKIRAQIALNGSVAPGLIPPLVQEYLLRHKLYGTQTSE